jgi:hypothetical protein
MKVQSVLAASTLALAGALVAAPAAQACPVGGGGGCDDSDISVRVSDVGVASGQQFVARGLLIMGGLPAPDHTVRVMALRGDEWTRLPGATVLTNDEGRYRVRLALAQRGERTLRVVGVGQGDEPTQFQRFTVRVR